MNAEGMTLEEIIAHLRKKYGCFKCPKKSDRLEIPEDIWKQIDWTRDEIEINGALPHKMWNMRHDDHIWPLCYKFRGVDAYGPRAKGNASRKFIATPPALVEGRGITRWMAIADESVLEIPLFNGYLTTWTPDNIPDELHVIERKPGHQNFGKVAMMKKNILFQNYGPSALQKFSDKSWLRRDPYHISYHRMFKRREVIGKTKDVTGADSVYFYRYGWRWDSHDNYYIKRAKYIGGRWN